MGGGGDPSSGWATSEQHLNYRLVYMDSPMGIRHGSHQGDKVGQVIDLGNLRKQMFFHVETVTKMEGKSCTTADSGSVPPPSCWLIGPTMMLTVCW
jgi:hypothetical protein